MKGNKKQSEINPNEKMKIINANDIKSKNNDKKALYKRSKANYKAYNEAYNYLKYRIRPERIKNSSSFSNWKKDIERSYYLSKKPQ